MPKTINTFSRRPVLVPTPEESTAINAGIAADPDTYELSASEFKALRRVGRPRVAVKRPMLSMRTDPDVLEKLRASGPGWQTRVNALLRDAVLHGRV